VSELLGQRYPTRQYQAAALPDSSDGSLAATLIAALPAGVAVVDAQGQAVMVNRSAERMGIRPGELPGDRLVEIVARARRSGGPCEAEILLPPPIIPPLRRPRPNQPGVDVHVRALPLDVEGHVALVLDDLTESRRVDAVRRDFVANVSHELKTPVGAMRLLAEALESASNDPDAVRRFAGRIAHESGRLGRLVQDLIDLSRLQGGEPQPDFDTVSLRRVVTEAVDRTRLGADARKIQIAVVMDEELREEGSGPAPVELVEVWGDETQLTTAVANLVDNAVAYSPEGTRVVVGLRLRRGAEAATTGLVAELSVADEGVGIPDAEQERVFERFYRVDPARSRATGGTGLGLAIVKHVATNHGGSVSVWSSEGVGSTFTMQLPARLVSPLGDAAPMGASAQIGGSV
jgi:two-component system sensor histidine kinase SenX3